MMFNIEVGLCLLFLLIWTPSNSALLCLSPSDCNDGNPCTKDDCTLLGLLGLLCTYQNQPQGFICSDGNYCNGLETCNGAGQCVSGTPPCATSTNPCNNTCNESAQNCLSPVNTPCSDGLFCTTNDKCNGQGKCTAGTSTPCDGGTVCNRQCNEVAQNCFSNTSTTCDDGIFCNGPDRCNGSGGCGIHLGNPCVNVTGDCKTTTCTEQNKCNKPQNTTCTPDGGDTFNCTLDFCNGNGTCAHLPVTTCDDGNPCTDNTVCVPTGGGGYTCAGNWVCACAVPADCDDGNSCTNDTCAAGSCQHTAVGNGTVCNDFVWCNGPDTCMGGTCTPSYIPPCNMANPCNNTCNETSKTCESPVNTVCTDGQWCTEGDYCNGAGVCLGGLLTPCSGNPFCNSICNETEQHCFTPSGTDCDNTIYCDGTETCDGLGECVSSGNPCLGEDQCRRACDEQTEQCVWNANGVFCSGDRCQGDWFCINGMCTATLVSPCNSTQCCNTNVSLPLCYTDATCPVYNTTGEATSSSSGEGIPMWYYIAAAGAALVLLCLILSLILALIFRRRRKDHQEVIYKSESTQGFINRIYSPSSREDEIAMGTIGAFYASTGEFGNASTRSIQFVEECRVSDVIMGRMVGSGNFGKVYQGVWSPPDEKKTEVALKTLKDRELFEDFISEAVILREFNHINVVKFYGVYINDGVNYIVTEFMNRGSLLDLLQSVHLNLDALKEMALGAARGMEYLHSKNVIHRDLACRNLLVTYVNGHYIVKVSDFGMSRASQSYYYSESNRIPIKWSPPEVLRHKKYTPKSDVWSYGVTLWEMYSGGVEPYTAMSNSETVEAVISGYRMAPPNGCPDTIHNIMTLCWEEDFHKRITFTEVVELVKDSTTASPSMYDNVTTQPEENDLPPSYEETDKGHHETSHNDFYDS